MEEFKSVFIKPQYSTIDDYEAILPFCNIP
jgi:hypothetical protein